MRTYLLAAIAAVCPVYAQAQTVDGLYVALGAGINVSGQPTPKVVGSASPFAVSTSKLSSGTGARFGIIAGWGFGNGLRTEIELSILGNAVNGNRPASASGARRNAYVTKAVAIQNLVYDFAPWVIGGKTGGWHLSPYVGAGIGIAGVYEHNSPDVTLNGSDAPLGGRSRTAVAGQLIAGLAVPVTSRLEVTLDYRALIVGGGDDTRTATSGSVSKSIKLSRGTALDNGVMIGLRYRFGTLGR